MGGGPVNARRQRYQTQDINNNAPPDMSQSSLYPNYQYVPVPPQQFHYYSYYNAPPPPPPQSIHPLPLPPPLPPIPAAYARSRMTIESTSPPPAMAAVETSQQGQPVRLIYTKSGFHVRPSANTNTSINGFLMIVSKGESVCVDRRRKSNTGSVISWNLGIYRQSWMYTSLGYLSTSYPPRILRC